jgi:hypothetical protein
MARRLHVCIPPWCIYFVCDMTLYIYIYTVYLTAVGLTPGDSSTVHIYTQTTHRIQITEYTYQSKNLKLIWEVRAVLRLCELYPGICLTTEEKTRKNLSQGRSMYILSSHSTV